MVSPKTLRILHTIIASSLQQAWKWGWVPENVARRVDLAPTVQPDRRDLPPIDQLLAVFTDLDEHRPNLAAMIRIAASTGLRPR